MTLLKVPETLSDEVLGKMGAPGVGKDDEEASAGKLADYDGFLFGLSARFGMASAQVKALLDSTGGLWQAGALVGKPAGVFFSTGTQNGGQETTALTFVTQLAHHGMVFVPLGYSTPKLFDLSAPPRRLALRRGHAGRPRRLAPAVRAREGHRRGPRQALRHDRRQAREVSRVAPPTTSPT